MREPRLDEATLDSRLDIELLDQIGLLADQLADAARELLIGLLARLEQVEGAPTLAERVRDPGLEAKTLDLGELVDGLVAEIPAQLLNRRLRVGEVPEDNADED